MLQVSVLPRCSRVTDILDAHTLLEALKFLVLAAVDALVAIFTESYLSLAAVLCLYVLCWCIAKSGGYGTIPGPAQQPVPGKRESFWESMALRCAQSPCCLAPLHTSMQLMWQRLHVMAACFWQMYAGIFLCVGQDMSIVN